MSAISFSNPVKGPYHLTLKNASNENKTLKAIETAEGLTINITLANHSVSLAIKQPLKTHVDKLKLLPAFTTLFET